MSAEHRLPEAGSLWERSDEVFRVESVYEAKQRQADGSLTPVTLVKIICVEPMPIHYPFGRFVQAFEPYDPDAP